jgi:hypothetical protein
MAKKRQRAHQVSKGERRPQDPRWSKEARKEWVNSTAQMHAKILAFKAGKNVMLTINNPNNNETNKPFIRVNAKDVWRNA